MASLYELTGDFLKVREMLFDNWLVCLCNKRYKV